MGPLKGVRIVEFAGLRQAARNRDRHRVPALNAPRNAAPDHAATQRGALVVVSRLSAPGTLL